MTEAIDISPEHRSTVVDLIKRHLPDTIVWAYGSRVKGTARPQSDLDLVAFATGEQDMDIFNIKEAFEESDLPDSFRKNIEEQYAILQEKRR